MRGEAATAVPNRGLITFSIMLANIMQGIDNTILNVALPHIQGSLSASQDQIAWALTSYIVCAAIMMPLTGWLAGRFGIKYIFFGSVIGFTAASALCGAAESLPQLVIYRILQGMFGAGKFRILLEEQLRQRVGLFRRGQNGDLQPRPVLFHLHRANKRI